jgi:hypothetical protein
MDLKKKIKYKLFYIILGWFFIVEKTSKAVKVAFFKKIIYCYLLIIYYMNAINGFDEHNSSKILITKLF